MFARDWQEGLWLRERSHMRERGCKAEKGTEGHRRCDLRKELQYIIWKREGYAKQASSIAGNWQRWDPGIAIFHNAGRNIGG